MAHAFARDLALGLAGFAAGAVALIVSSSAQADQASAHAAIIAPSPDRATRAFTRAPDGMFYAHATINGRPLRFLVDTGATVVTLTAADARRVGLMPGRHAFTGKVETANGSGRMAWATADRLGIAGREVRGLQVAVIEQGLGVSLLGQNALSRLGAVTIDGDSLSMG